MKRGFLQVLLPLFALPIWGETGRYRLTWRDDPATTMVVAWDQKVGDQAVLYYDTVDHGRQAQAYAFSTKPHITRFFKGMRNTFARLEGLKPDTAYYFIVADNNTVSSRMWFKTAPANSDPFTFIAGGNTHNNHAAFIRANRMAARLRPLFILFTGDMTADNSAAAWKAWFDQWQETMTPDGRIFPILPTRGEREHGDETLFKLFDLKNPNLYHALSFGDRMLRVYALNSQGFEGGAQAAWLKEDLKARQDHVWRIALYHHPMRPHNRVVPTDREYRYWADLFYYYDVQLAIEGHGQTVKTTQALRPETGPGSEDGFIATNLGGTVYVGEGSWGAAIRAANQPRSWTRESGSFPQFKWVRVSKDEVTLRTVLFDNVGDVGEVDARRIYQPPENLKTWGSTSDPITLTRSDAPTVSIVDPTPSALFKQGDVITLHAQISPCSPKEVRFYQDGVLLGKRTEEPWRLNTIAQKPGNHLFTIEATSHQGLTGKARVSAGVDYLVLTVPVAHGRDDAEEFSHGEMYLNSTDFELTEDTALDPQQTLALRFNEVNLPEQAVVLSAAIQFTVDELSLFDTQLTIKAQASSDAAPFIERPFNITRRPQTKASVNWTPPTWTQLGASGPDQRTPDLGSLINEIRQNHAWRPGNSLVFIFQGSGRHVAKTHEGLGPAVLQIAYALDSGNHPGDAPHE